MLRNKSVLWKILIRKDKLLAVMLLNGHRVPFQLDTGATVNILPEETFKEIYGDDSLPLLDNAEVTLVMYNETEEKPIGKKRVRVVNPRNGRKYSVEFVVVKGTCKPLLGFRASEQMQLISVVRQTFWLFNLKNHHRAVHHLQQSPFSKNMQMSSEEKESWKVIST